MFGWEKVNGTRITGTAAEGDPTVPATRWWNLPFLLRFYWKKVTVFEVILPSKDGWIPDIGYRVGYKTDRGVTLVCNTILRGMLFRVRNGREDCTFFIIDLDDREREIRMVRQTDIADPMYASVPLI